MPILSEIGFRDDYAAKPAEDHPAQAHVEHHRASDDGMPERDAQAHVGGLRGDEALPRDTAVTKRWNPATQRYEHVEPEDIPGFVTAREKFLADTEKKWERDALTPFTPSIPEKMQELADRERPTGRPVIVLDPKTPVQSTQDVWNAATQDAYTKIALEAAAELRRGDAIHGRGIVWPTNSVSHEAYGVLLEEVDELWDEVKKKHFDRAAARKEAIQVAAMAIRFVMNVCDENPDVPRYAGEPNGEDALRELGRVKIAPSGQLDTGGWAQGAGTPDYGWVCFNDGPGGYHWCSTREACLHELTDESTIRRASATEKSLWMMATEAAERSAGDDTPTIHSDQRDSIIGSSVKRSG